MWGKIVPGAIVLLFLVGPLGCGKKGPPQPPVAQISMEQPVTGRPYTPVAAFLSAPRERDSLEEAMNRSLQEGGGCD